LTDERDAGEGANLLNDEIVLVTGGNKNNGGKPFLDYRRDLSLSFAFVFRRRVRVLLQIGVLGFGRSQKG
jgi:hypothetical protein